VEQALACFLYRRFMLIRETHPAGLRVGARFIVPALPTPRPPRRTTPHHVPQSSRTTDHKYFFGTSAREEALTPPNPQAQSTRRRKQRIYVAPKTKKREFSPASRRTSLCSKIYHNDSYFVKKNLKKIVKTFR